VTFESLWELGTVLRHELPDVAVDISSPAIRRAVESYPAIFLQQGNCIRQTGAAEEYLRSDYFNYEFANAVSPELNGRVRDIVARTIVGRNLVERVVS
jgi:hypothetical protein